MSAPIPSIEPSEIFSGDTIAWTKDLSDYPADVWTLNYYFRGPHHFTVLAAAAQRTFAITISATTSATYPKGTYDWIAFASSGSSRYQVGSGSMVIKENPATAVVNYETRSQAKQILDALMATQLQNAGRGEMQYRVEAAGRLHVFYTHADLITAIEKWKAIVQQEEDAKKIARGENTGKNIFVRFT